MSRIETLEQEYLAKSLEHFLFQVFDCGFDYLIVNDLISLQETYIENSPEWCCVEYIIQQIEKLDDTKGEQGISEVEDTTTSEVLRSKTPKVACDSTTSGQDVTNVLSNTKFFSISY